MRKVTVTVPLFALVFTIAVALAAFADDQEKATKEIKKITSISVDANMRSVVNRSMADMLKAKRLDLVKQRQDLNVNYGGLFLVYQLTAGGAKIDDIAAQLKAGKKIFDIANDDHANWKEINSEAKKLNKKIDENMQKYFMASKKQAAADQADEYDAKVDHVAADSDISKDEYADAQKRYQQVHDLASSQLPTGDANANGQGAGMMQTAPVSSSGKR